MTDMDIHNWCRNPAVFARGRAMYKRHMVGNVEKKELENGLYWLYGKVIGSSGTDYAVSVLVHNTNGIQNGHCTCPDHAAGREVCKHMVAMTLEYIKPAPIEAEQIEGRTTSTVRSLIETYTVREQQALPSQQYRGKVRIDPILRLEAAGLRLEIKVGAGRTYIIKDIAEFIGQVKRGEYIQYGKDFGFVHVEEMFNARSRKLLGFLKEKIAADNEMINSMPGHSVLFDMRQLIMTPRDMDSFFDVMEGETITAWLPTNMSLTLVRRNPALTVVIEGKGDEGASIATDKYRVFPGVSCCYAVRNGMMYRCSDDFSADMESFLRLTGTSCEWEMTVSKKDLPAFCASVLPSVSKWTFLKEKNINLEDFSPLPELFRFYLDMPDSSELTCRPAVRYGDIEVNLLEDYQNAHINRNLNSESRVRALLARYFDIPTEPVETLRIISDDELIYNFLETGVSELMNIGEVYASEGFKKAKILTKPNVTVGVKVESDLLKLEVDCEDIPRDELRALLSSYRKKMRFHRLKNGKFVALEASSFDTVSELAEGLQMTGAQLMTGTIEAPVNRALYVDSVLKEGQGITLRRDHLFRELIKNMNSAAEAEFEAPESMAKILRTYQTIGFRWLKTIEHYGFGGILADEMGLGKTIQVIALLLSEAQSNGRSSLIVCPASLVYNWLSEFRKFAPSMKCVVVAGTADERAELIADYTNCDVLITSYDLLRRDIEHYGQATFRYCIIDEAQYIKNHDTLSAKSVKTIRAATRFALTGTPIENRLSELWSIFDFLMPGFLYNYNRFREKIETPIVKDGDKTVTERLHRMIAPFILRRLKKDVLRELPDKLEQCIYSRMGDEQSKLYRAHAAQLVENLRNQTNESYGAGKLQVLSELTKLRQICCDPSLSFESYKGGSAKLETCMEKISNAVSGGHKILLFSQFTSMLSIIAQRLTAEGISYYLITGSTGKEQRLSLVNAFNRDDTSVFLISLKAGGTGLNLTSADIVIHYDPWWNVAAQDQATDRAHRIGQRNVVTVLKLIAQNTIEEKIVALQESKRELADSVISRGGSTIGDISRDELIELLTEE